MNKLNLKKYLGAMFCLVVIYSLIINLTILLVLVLGSGNKEAEQQISQVPDRIVIDDVPELDIVEEYDFAMEGVRV